MRSARYAAILSGTAFLAQIGFLGVPVGLAAPPPRANLALTKDAPATIGDGENVTYSFTVTNSGPDDATNIVVEDLGAPELTFVSSSGLTCADVLGTTECVAFALANGESKEFDITFSVADVPCGTEITNEASVTGEQQDTQKQDNSDDAVVTVTCDTPPSGADVSLVKTAPATVQSGSVLTYTFLVENSGPEDATHVVVEDLAFPAELAFLSSVGLDCKVVHDAVECKKFDLSASGSFSFTMDFLVNAPCDATLVNTAAVTSKEEDPNPANNTSQAQTQVLCGPAASADLELQKTGPVSADEGDLVVYNFTVTNHGPDTATDIVVEDLGATGLSFDSSTGLTCADVFGTTECVTFELASGASLSFNIFFRVDEDSCGMSIVNTASVTALQADPNPANNTDSAAMTVTCPLPASDLNITKAGTGSVQRGGSLTYVLTARNEGPDGTSAVITDPLPAGLTFNAAASSPECAQDGAEIVCDGFDLLPGEERVFIIVFTVIADCNSTVQNSASISGYGTDANISDNTSNTVETLVTCTVSSSSSSSSSSQSSSSSTGTGASSSSSSSSSTGSEGSSSSVSLLQAQLQIDAFTPGTNSARRGAETNVAGAVMRFIALGGRGVRSGVVAIAPGGFGGGPTGDPETDSAKMGADTFADLTEREQAMICAVKRSVTAGGRSTEQRTGIVPWAAEQLSKMLNRPQELMEEILRDPELCR